MPEPLLGRKATVSGSAARKSLFFASVALLGIICVALSSSWIATKQVSIPTENPTPASHVRSREATPAGVGIASRRSLTDSKYGKVLVLYVFSNTDPEYEENLHYFVREGCRPSPSVDYLFVVQRGRGTSPLKRPLPDLPPNARYIFHDNECFDWGTFGWALEQSKIVDKQAYQHFIFMNSSVRGPFMPSYVRDRTSWEDVLLSKLTDDVKLVGCTISCERGAQPRDNPKAPPRQNPHVQSYAVATDQKGLSVLEKDGSVFKCHSTLFDAIYYAELGSSRAILEAGYNIDSLLTRYEGVDWRNHSNWQCNGRMNPFVEHTFDGISLHPMEVMFTKVKKYHMEFREHPAYAAVKLGQWRTQQQQHGKVDSVNSNDLPLFSSYFKALKTLSAAIKDKMCWDSDFYLASNKDLPQLWPKSHAFNHFLKHGLLESRAFRYNCTTDLDALELRAAALAEELSSGACEPQSGYAALKQTHSRRLRETR